VEDLLLECLGLRVGAAYRRVDRLLNRAFAAVGLTHAHGHVLACVLAAGEIRIGDIARRTGFESSTVSRLVKELVRRKLVRRRADPEDGRAVLLRPGARAEAIRGDIVALLHRADERLRRELTGDDLRGFFNTVDIMDRLP